MTTTRCAAIGLIGAIALTAAPAGFGAAEPTDRIVGKPTGPNTETLILVKGGPRISPWIHIKGPKK